MGRDGQDSRRNDSGRGRGGRSSGRFRGKSRDARSSNNQKKTVQLEMKFGPQGQGGPRCHTFQTVKEAVLSYIQRTKKDGKDVRVSLDKEEIVDLSAVKPKLQIDRKSTRLNSSHLDLSRMPSSA